MLKQSACDRHASETSWRQRTKYNREPSDGSSDASFHFWYPRRWRHRRSRPRRPRRRAGRTWDSRRCVRPPDTLASRRPTTSRDSWRHFRWSESGCGRRRSRWGLRRTWDGRRLAGARRHRPVCRRGTAGRWQVDRVVVEVVRAVPRCSCASWPPLVVVPWSPGMPASVHRHPLTWSIVGTDSAVCSSDCRRRGTSAGRSAELRAVDCSLDV